MILDLVLPIEDGLEADAKNGVQFLQDIHSNPMIKPPIHIVGLSGFSDKVTQYHEQFQKKLWNLIDYEADSTGWHEQLKTIIFHLVKTKQRFLQSTLEKQLDVLFANLKEKGYPNTFLGHDWKTICRNLISIIERTFDVPSKFSNGLKAKNINVESLKISSEYDFQNIMHLVLRPWIPTLEAENIAVIFDGNTKNADFSINANAIIIEAKYIDTNGKKNDTMKTIEGLKDFYKGNGNVRALIFILLVEDCVDIDKYKIESQFSQLTNEPIVYVSVIINSLKK